MAKMKTKRVYEPEVQQVIGDGGEDMTVVRMVEKKYQMVPFDLETHANLIELLTLRGMPRRAQGAMMRILVRDALAAEKARASGELSPR